MQTDMEQRSVCAATLNKQNRRFKFEKNRNETAKPGVFRIFVECGNKACKHRRPNGNRVKLALSPGDHTPTDEELINRAQERGWHIGADRSEHRCPGCVQDKAKSMEKPKAAQPPTWEGLPPAKRNAIIKALFESYDIENSRYLPGCSDKTVAADVDVPWGYVRHARDMNGLPGDREDVAEAKNEIEAFRKKISGLADDINTLVAELAAMERRLNEIH